VEVTDTGKRQRAMADTMEVDSLRGNVSNLSMSSGEGRCHSKHQCCGSRYESPRATA
jgi:hypothetical protein